MRSEAGPKPLQGRRVVIHVCGGVAAVKVPALITALRSLGAEVRVAMTQSATRFIRPVTMRALSGHQVSETLFPARGRQEEDGHGMAHLSLSAWGECHLVVPATANTLAKLALGLADDPVSTSLLSTTAPVLLAPAMEEGMWRNPATRANLDALLGRGYQVVGPVRGRMASGAFGEGRMAEPEQIVNETVELLRPSGELAGCTVLITAGGTRERIDPVRYLSNRSSGRMGWWLAEQAARRGASVVLVSAAEQVGAAPGVELVPVETAEEMLGACRDRLGQAQVVLMAAAVADYRVDAPSEVKLHRGDSPELQLRLVANVDILRELLRQREPGCLIVGFAAETEDVIAKGQAKLRSKGCDMVVANPVSGPHSSMGGEMAEAALLVPGEEPTMISWQSKSAVASAILDRVCQLRRARATGGE